MTIIYLLYFFMNYCTLFNIHIMRIYHVSNPIIFFKTKRIKVSDTCTYGSCAS